MRRKIWSVYKAEIERLFSKHITVEEARTIGDALARAVKAARASAVGGAPIGGGTRRPTVLAMGC
jgi:hypothetical protein